MKTKRPTKEQWAIATEKVRERYEKLRAAQREFERTGCAYCDLAEQYDAYGDCEGIGCPLGAGEKKYFCNPREDDIRAETYGAVCDAREAVRTLLGILPPKKVK